MLSVTLIMMGCFYIAAVQSIRRKDSNLTALFLFIFFCYVSIELMLQQLRG